MTATLEKQLQKFGLTKTDLESLSETLPNDIWITASEHNLKKQRAHFIFIKVKEKEWVGSLNVTNSQTSEVYTLHQVKTSALKEAVAEMIVFVYQQKLTSPSQ